MNFLTKHILLILILIYPFTTLAQQTKYKVVCDKNEKKLKIVEADNRSPDYVPVKSGFPFESLAREWIEEHFTSWDCEPEEMIKDNEPQKPDEQPPATSQQPTPPPTSSPAAPPPRQGTPMKTQTNVSSIGNSAAVSHPPVKFKNTSISFLLLFHTLDQTLGVDDNNLGFGMSLEQLFGKKFYGGTGLHFHMLSAEAKSESVDMYMFKFPVFAGYRLAKRKSLISLDAGIFISTKLQAFEGSEIYFKGHEPSDVSFSFFPRLRLGTVGFQIELAAEIWLDEIVENMDKLTVYHVGARFSF